MIKRIMMRYGIKEITGGISGFWLWDVCKLNKKRTRINIGFLYVEIERFE